MRLKISQVGVMATVLTLLSVTATVAINFSKRMYGVDTSPSVERVVEIPPQGGGEFRKGNMVARKHTLLVKAEKEVFTPGEQILLKVTLSNNSQEEIYIVETGTLKDYLLEVRDRAGKKVPVSKKGKKILDSPFAKRVVSKIEPGQAVQDEINVGDLFDLSAGFSYVITVKRTVLMQDKKKSAEMESNPVMVIIQQ